MTPPATVAERLLADAECNHFSIPLAHTKNASNFQNHWNSSSRALKTSAQDCGNWFEIFFFQKKILLTKYYYFQVSNSPQT